MTFYLTYDFGSCYDGSHSAGLLEFETLEEAIAEGDRLYSLHLGDGGYAVIEGKKVKERQ